MKNNLNCNVNNTTINKYFFQYFMGYMFKLHILKLIDIRVKNESKKKCFEIEFVRKEMVCFWSGPELVSIAFMKTSYPERSCCQKNGQFPLEIGRQSAPVRILTSCEKLSSDLIGRRPRKRRRI